MTQWYYVDPQHQRQGPVTAEVIAQLYRSGALTRASLAWREGMSQWTPMGELATELGIADPAPVSAPPMPPASLAVETDTPVERPLTGRAVFTASEPTYTQYTPPHASQSEAVAAAAMAARPVAPAMDGGASASSPYAAPRADIGGYASTPVYEGHVVYAGFWKRVAAYLIDYLLTSVVGGMVGMVIGVAAGGAGLADDASGMMALQVVSGLVGFAISLVYFSGFHASSLQATPGKLAIGIKVTRGDGSPISFWRGIGRCFAMILSGLILCIGYVMAGFTERKQGLHDLICDTLVVDKWAFSRHPEQQREALGVVAWVVLGLGIALFLIMGLGFGAMMAALR